MEPHVVCLKFPVLILHLLHAAILTMTWLLFSVHVLHATDSARRRETEACKGFFGFSFLKARMNRSPIFTKYPTEDSYGCGFDYGSDFTQFLEEARTDACRGTSTTAASLEAEGIKQFDKEKKNLKSWKNSLFSWLKIDTKNKSTMQQPNNYGTAVSKPRRRQVSGPVRGTGGGITNDRAQTSSPLTGLFSSKKRVEECKLPYICLDLLKNPHEPNSCGSVYLVTWQQIRTIDLFLLKYRLIDSLDESRI